MFQEFLTTIPRFEVVKEVDENVKAILFDGAAMGKTKTKVFAFIGIPKNASGKIPAMVLVHGGGGTASLEWVRLWNRKGFGAISVDTCGNRPTDYSTVSAQAAIRDAYSAPNNSSFSDYEKPPKEQFFYHALSSVMLAASLLGSLPEIDNQKLGITGISWGGIITSYVIGVDSRFRFAIPVYGSGFLYQSRSIFGRITKEEKKRLWDPSFVLNRAKMPVLFINDTVDCNFSIEITSESAAITNDSRILYLEGMGHSHEQGWLPEDIYRFAESVLGRTESYPRITYFDQSSALFESGAKIKKAILYYTDNLNYETNNQNLPLFLSCWQQKEFMVTNQKKQSFYVPNKTAAYFMNLTDELGRTVSTRLMTTQ